MAFPERGWRDFVVPVLSWWAEAAVRLLDGRTQQESVPFMDGPYRVDVNIEGRPTWRLDLVEIRQSGDLSQTSLVDPRPLLESFVAGSAAVERAYDARGWLSGDVEAMAAGRRRLEERIGGTTSREGGERDCRFIDAVRRLGVTLSHNDDVRRLQRSVEGMADAMEGDVHPDLRLHLPRLAGRLELIAVGLEGPEAAAARQAIEDFLRAVGQVCPEAPA